jgi:hypothetical protein
MPIVGTKIEFQSTDTSISLSSMGRVALFNCLKRSKTTA